MRALLRTLVLLPVLLAATSARGQEVMRYGVKLGATAAELHNGGSSDARWGATASVFATSPLGSGFQLLGEAGYHEKGTYNEFEFQLSDGEFGRGTSDLRLDYAFLLVAPQYRGALGDGGLDLFVFAGPRADLFLGEARTTTVEPEGEFEPSGFLPLDFSAFVLGATAGIGLDFSRLLPVPLTAELRYNGDVTPAYTFFSGEEQVRNRTFDLRLGLSF
jgi:hypothetical protein